MKKVNPGPLVYVEVEASYRWEGSAAVCCFLTLIEQRGNLHRRVVESRHIAAPSPEELVDLVTAATRNLTLEYVVAQSLPF